MKALKILASIIIGVSAIGGVVMAIMLIGFLSPFFYLFTYVNYLDVAAAVENSNWPFLIFLAGAVTLGIMVPVGFFVFVASWEAYRRIFSK